MARQNCVYCGKEIVTRSREHVIQNALGGLYESEDICCPECNNYISKCIDAPFTKIFNPILSSITDFSKTKHTKSKPSYTGKILYNNKIYTASFKAGKVISCPDLSRELKCDISKLPLQIVAYDFDIDNENFRTGMAKIAFNYALDKGIDYGLLKRGLKIQKHNETIQKVSFDYPMIPFYPLNPVDTYIELKTNFDLYHSLILFSQQNHLWCYVDLFNTFQYYVLLSDNMPEKQHVYSNYAQTLQKPNRDIQNLDIYSPKDIIIYAQQYGIDPCMDKNEFCNRVRSAILRTSQKQPLEGIISKKMAEMPFDYSLHLTGNLPLLMEFNQSMRLYFDSYNKLRKENFRTVTTFKRNTFSYPYAITKVIKDSPESLRYYTTFKFNRLINFLNQKTK